MGSTDDRPAPVRKIEGAECALKKRWGNVRGNKRPDFELHPREQDYEAGRSTEEAYWRFASAASTTNLNQRVPGSSPVALLYLARRNKRKLPRKFHLGAWEESLGGLVVHLQAGVIEHGIG